VKSRSSQCNETLLVRAAIRPSKKKLAATAMTGLTPANCSRQTDAAGAGKVRSPMVERTVRRTISADVV